MIAPHSTDERRAAPAERHARQIVLPQIGAAGQARLAEARVLVVGCGGLGAPVIHYLAAAGVSHLHLMDDDVVEPSNLNRQVLHREVDVGRRKVERALEVVRALDPSLAVTGEVARLTVDDARARVKQADVVVDCTDGMPTKFLLNDACVLEDRALVHGACTAFAGQVMVVPGRNGPCLRCLFPELPPQDAVPSCREAGILGAVCGVVGSMMAAEVVKHLVGASTLVGRYLAVDVLGPTVRAIDVPRDAACPACGEHPEVDAATREDYVLPRACVVLAP